MTGGAPFREREIPPVFVLRESYCRPGRLSRSSAPPDEIAGKIPLTFLRRANTLNHWMDVQSPFAFPCIAIFAPSRSH